MAESSEILRILLALRTVPHIGNKKAKSLLQHFDGQTGAIFSASPRQLEQVAGIGRTTALSLLTFDRWDEVDKMQKQIESGDFPAFTIFDQAYPSWLAQTADAPLVLWYRGDLSILSSDYIAVVGTRSASAYGRKITHQLVAELTKAGLGIVSGLALGIDAEAHVACLKSNAPTIAVLGSGIDVIYPGANAKLYHQIVEQKGLILSEQPPGTKPDAGNFPERNRIVSGLSLGTVVIETGKKGGSMITARLALDQNRGVFALPHQVDYLRGEGCNWLLQNGLAKLVMNADDILEDIQFNRAESSGTQPEKEQKPRDWSFLSDQQKALMQVLEAQEHQIDDLAEVLGRKTSELLVDLLELEFQGHVKQLSGKRFTLQ